MSMKISGQSKFLKRQLATDFTLPYAITIELTFMYEYIYIYTYHECIYTYDTHEGTAMSVTDFTMRNKYRADFDICIHVYTDIYIHIVNALTYMNTHIYISLMHLYISYASGHSYVCNWLYHMQ